MLSPGQAVSTTRFTSQTPSAAASRIAAASTAARGAAMCTWKELPCGAEGRARSPGVASTAAAMAQAWRWYSPIRGRCSRSPSSAVST